MRPPAEFSTGVALVKHKFINKMTVVNDGIRFHVGLMHSYVGAQSNLSAVSVNVHVFVDYIPPVCCLSFMTVLQHSRILVQRTRIYYSVPIRVAVMNLT
jgi:hypothetical protein